MKIKLMYSIPSMSMSTVQQRDPDDIHLLLLAFSFILFHRVLSQVIGYSSLFSPAGPPCLSMCSVLFLASTNPKLPVHPLLPHSALATTHLFSMSVVSSVFSPACHLLSPHHRARYLLAPGCFIPIKSIQADMRYTAGPVSC